MRFPYDAILIFTLASIDASGQVANVGDSSDPSRLDTVELESNPSQVSQTFLSTASFDGITEVELGELALKKSGSFGVKRLARQMVADYGRINEELASIASRKHVMVPEQPDADQQATIKDLQRNKGAGFDRGYIAATLSAHDKAITAFNAARAIGDSDITAFAGKNLPILKTHKQMLLDLQGKRPCPHPCR